MKLKDKLIIVLGTLIILATLTTIFKKKNTIVIKKNIDDLTFNDTITRINYYKDDEGSGIETRIKNNDTGFCFSGYNYTFNIVYPAYAKKGDIILKKKYADTFYIKRGKDTINFVLSKCQ